jgi:hypothetical protein
MSDDIKDSIVKLISLWREQGSEFGPSTGALARKVCADQLEALMLKKDANMNREQFIAFWSSKSVKALAKEAESWRKHFQKHNDGYGFKGCNRLTPPGEMSDGERYNILRDLIAERTVKENLTVGVDQSWNRRAGETE